MFSPKLLRCVPLRGNSLFTTSSKVCSAQQLAVSENLTDKYRKPVNLVNYSGSRVLELSRAESGNIVTEGILGTLKYRFGVMSEIPTIQTVIISSSSPELFSNGLGLRFIDDKKQRKEFVTQAHEISQSFGDLDKETIAIYSGDVDACSFGLFATAKFRLGTDSTSFKLLDLLEGRLPLGGGIAHHLAHSTEKGYALARYLGVSGRPLSSHDLLSLGLVTHIVSSNVPADSLCIALAHSIPDSDKIKAVQSTQTHRPAVREILDSMHLYMTRNDFWGANQLQDGQPADFAEVEEQPAPEQELPVRAKALKDLERKARFGKEAVTLSKKTQRALQRERETYQHKQAEKEAWAATRDANFKAGRISLLEHPVWNRATLVTPIKADGDMFFDNEATRATAEDLEDVIEEVVHCFSADSVVECRRRVQEVASSGRPGVQVGDWVEENWAVRALAKWDTVDTKLVEEWFSMTKQAAEMSLPELLAIEADKAANA